MSISTADEKRLLAADELELVDRSHYPDISALDRSELGDMAKRLRALRDRARDMAHRQRREIRGKSDPRGARPAGDNTGTEMKRRVLASALKRVNRELARFAAADRAPAAGGDRAPGAGPEARQQDRPPSRRRPNRTRRG